MNAGSLGMSGSGVLITATLAKCVAAVVPPCPRATVHVLPDTALTCKRSVPITIGNGVPGGVAVALTVIEVCVVSLMAAVSVP